MTIGQEALKMVGAATKKEVVLQLQKSLYGLKQAGRLWSQLLHARLLEAGFRQCISDICLYYQVECGQLVIVGVYVDDLLATGTDAAAVDRFFVKLGSLSIKDLGTVSKFLGMRVTIDNSAGYVLDQAEAIGELLREHGLEDANPTKAPIVADCYDLLPDDSALLTETKVKGAPTIKTFQSLVGSLLWIARCTRPDIAFAVHKATRQNHPPRLHDMKLVKRIARFLKGTRDYKLRVEPAKAPRRQDPAQRVLGRRLCGGEE